MTALVFITLIIAASRICSLGEQRFAIHFILIVRFRAWLYRTYFIFAFAPTVALPVSCLTVNRSSNVSSNLARYVSIVVNCQFVFCKFLFLALLLNMCNALVKYHVFPKPDINWLVSSFWICDIMCSTSFLSVKRKFRVTFVDHRFNFLKIFEFSSRTTSSAPFWSTFYMSESVCIDKLICISPPLLSLDFRWRIK